MSEPGHDKDHRLGRGAQPLEARALGGAERLAALRTDAAPVLARMEANSALADLASGGPRPVGAACRGGGHACPPSSVGERPQRSMSGPLGA
jgi:hypothetical protein